MSADEFAPENASLVDDVGLREAIGAVEVAAGVVAVANGKQVEGVVGEELAIGGLVLISADGYNSHLWQAALKRDEGRQLLQAWRAPGCPEVEDDDLPTEGIQADGGGGIREGEVRCGLSDF